MLTSALLGALSGAITGPLALLAVRAWQRRRREPPMWAQHAWTEKPIFRGKA